MTGDLWLLAAISLFVFGGGALSAYGLVKLYTPS
jgi:hypothetical protein